MTEDVFRILVDTGEKEGALDTSQRDLIHGVFELGDKPVSEVMVPRVDMFCLPITMSFEDMEKEIITSRHRRVPIYGTDRDDILGILHVKNLLQHVVGEKKSIRIEKLLRKAYFVPENRSAATILRDFQANRIQMAIVVDEYGGVSGLVTLEDILEDLFSDIYEDYGLKKSIVQRIDDYSLLISGKMAMAEFKELTGLAVPSEDFDTVGGFVVHLFGKLPSKGDFILFNDYTFKVERMSGTRILVLRVEKNRKEHHA